MHVIATRLRAPGGDHADLIQAVGNADWCVEYFLDQGTPARRQGFADGIKGEHALQGRMGLQGERDMFQHR